MIHVAFQVAFLIVEEPCLLVRWRILEVILKYNSLLPCLRLRWIVLRCWVVTVGVFWWMRMSVCHAVRRDWSVAVWWSGSRLLNHLLWISDCLFNSLFYLADTTFPVKPTSNNVVSEHKFVQLFLQISILKGKKISMVLKCVELLFQSVADIT